MLNTIITLLSFIGLTFLIKESDILSTPRAWVVRRSPFAYKLLSCYFCTGFWSGIFICLVHELTLNPIKLSMWGLASATVNLIFGIYLDNTNKE